MDRAKAYHLAIELHEQGLGNRKIHRIIPEIGEKTIGSWIYEGHKPRSAWPEPDLSHFVELAKDAGKMNRQELYRTVIEFHKQGLFPRWIHKCIPQIPQSTIGSWVYDQRKPTRYSRARPHLVPNLSPSRELAYVLGTLYGDGSVTAYNSTMALMVNDEGFAVAFDNALKKIGLAPTSHIYHYRAKRRFAIRAYSKTVVAWIQNLTFIAIEKIVNRYEVGFIRGFYDSEGTLQPNGKYFKLSMANTKPDLLQLIQKMMLKIGFQSAIHKYSNQHPTRRNNLPLYVLNIHGGVKAITRFCELIQPSIPRKGIARINHEV